MYPAHPFSARWAGRKSTAMSDEPRATSGPGLVVLPSPSILDTNILVSSTASRRTLHGVAQSVVQSASLGGRTCVSGQILREYLVVATRPPTSNGLGLPPIDATANVSAFLSVMRCLDENNEVQEKTRGAGPSAGVQRRGHSRRQHCGHGVGTWSTSDRHGKPGGLPPIRPSR